ncbi:MAG TPA: hypothetical protein O0X39_01600 [Methanocorpusculum sp.]|nr:hypothetical protein [Methanocorpusculum sp.]
MKKYLIGIIIVLLAAAVLCTAGCVSEQKSPQEAILGEWTNPEYFEIDSAVANIYYIFKEDNTGMVEFRSNNLAVKTVNFRWMYVDEGDEKKYYLVAYTGLPRTSGSQAQSSFLTIINNGGKDYLYIFDGYSEGLALTR